MKKSQIAFLIFLGAFTLTVLASVMLYICMLISTDLESIGWAFLYHYIYVYPVQLVLFLVTLVIDLIFSKTMPKSLKVFGWITFLACLIFIMPMSKTFRFLSFLIDSGFTPIWLYLVLTLMFIVFIVMSVIDIIKHAKRNKIKEN